MAKTTKPTAKTKAAPTGSGKAIAVDVDCCDCGEMTRETCQRQCCLSCCAANCIVEYGGQHNDKNLPAELEAPSTDRH